jgi:hypothetical protein
MRNLVKIDHGRIVKEIPENKPEGRRGIERPRLRWFEDFGKHLRETKFKILRQKAVGREEWASVIKVERTLRRPQNE